METAFPLKETPPHVAGIVPSNAGANVNIRSYSDVVASRTPSNSRERPVVPLGIPAREPNRTLVLNQDQQQEGPGNYRIDESEVPIDDFNSSMEVGTPDRADSHWTTVHRRHTRIHGSLPDKKTVTAEQVHAIELATERMTQEQWQQVQRRLERVQPRREESVSSWGEGPSKPKGKMTDPHEWGNLNLSEEELSLEAQTAVLNLFAKNIKNTEYSNERPCHGKRTMTPHQERHRQHNQRGQQLTKRKHGCSRRPTESQPSAQISPKSYLGTALKGVGHSRRSGHPSKSPSDLESDASMSDQSSSLSSPTEEDTQGSDTSDDRPWPSKRRRDNHHGRNRPR